MMGKTRIWGIFLLLAVALATNGCSKWSAQKAIKLAEKAKETAIAAEAQRFADQTMTRGDEELLAANTALGGKEYDQAITRAQNALNHFDAAARDVPGAKVVINGLQARSKG